MTISVVIADDHGVLRAALRALLKGEPDMDVVGEAADGQETVKRTLELKPRVLLLDMTMPGPGGIEITRQIQKTLPQTRVLVLTVHEDERLVREALNAGAAGYIIKRAFDTELTDAIRAVADGNLYIHPALTRAFIKEQAAPASIAPADGPSESADEQSPLTRRETEVLQLIAKGYTNRQVADELSLSVRTVETHRANLMGKLGVTSRVELVRFAKERGWLDKDKS
jgi:two-component system, NarL family, response regulator NreC